MRCSASLAQSGDVRVSVASLKVLVVGCGSIGRRHARNLRILGVDHISALDRVPSLAQALAEEVGGTCYGDLDEALGGSPDAVLICTPPQSHLTMAEAFTDARCALFIEKPLAHTAQETDSFVRLNERVEVVTMVACNMRFHHGPATLYRLVREGVLGKVTGALIEAGQYLPEWRPNVDYRDTYSAHRGAGGGALLDFVHEFDYATWIFGFPDTVQCRAGRFGDLDLDVEDSADVIMGAEGGASTTIHVDYIQRSYSRSCKIIGTEGTLVWNAGVGITWYGAESRTRQFEEPAGYSMDNMYIEELRHFLDCVREERQTISPLATGIRVTRVVLAAKDAAARRETVRLR